MLRESLTDYIEMVTPHDVVDAMGIKPPPEYAAGPVIYPHPLSNEDQLLVETYSDALLKLASKAADRLTPRPDPHLSLPALDRAMRDYIHRAVSTRNRYMRRAWPILRRYQVANAVSRHE